MTKTQSMPDTSTAVEIAKDIFWVGMHLKNEPFQCHPYLIKNGSESILLDPGSMLEFDETIRKIQAVINIKNIKYIVLHHQDPDLVAAVPAIEKLINRDDLQIVTHSRMSLLIKHYLVTSTYYEIDKHENRLETKGGLTLEFHTTPYCHSPGAFVSYEPKTKTLFSSDIFGGIEESWNFYATKEYFQEAKLFHQEYMPSKDIFNYALSKIEALELNLIAPQHGSIIQKEMIAGLIEDMKKLDCGLYIDKKYNKELVDTIEELKQKDFLLLSQAKRAEMGELMGNIAHQWRQPLAIINTTVAILNEKSDTITADELRSKLEKIEKQTLYLSQTVEDFMSFYNPNQTSSFFNVANTIEKALQITTLNSISSLNIMKNIDEKVTLKGVENEFIQALVCIFANIGDILKTTSHTNPTLLINMTQNPNALELSIADNLGGIDTAIIGKIFDPYFSTKHKSLGTGLGLHIAKIIIENKMAGEITAKNSTNEAGHGAQFDIRINK